MHGIGIHTDMNRIFPPLRFHSLGIPHTVTEPTWVSCAYTQKIVKFHRMMMARGHEIIHYGHQRSDTECTELVPVTDDATLIQAYGEIDWSRPHYRFSTADSAYQTFISRAIPAIRSRARAGDILLCWWGDSHMSIARAVEDLGVVAVEPGIGYSIGQFARYRAYESHAVKILAEGASAGNSWTSWIIPNYFDPEEFTYSENKEPWVLYLGRINHAKGVSHCVRAAQAAGVEIVIAGTGDPREAGVDPDQPGVRYVGPAGPDQRRDLMSRASALVIATNYLEPFGGVQVEAMMSGTPVISPFMGAFAEVNIPGHTGWLFRNMGEFRDGILRRAEISPQHCRQQAMRYSLDAVAPQFEEFFHAVLGHNAGDPWYHM